MYYISCGNIISYGPCNMIKRGCPINILIENQYNLRPMITIHITSMDAFVKKFIGFCHADYTLSLNGHFRNVAIEK